MTMTGIQPVPPASVLRSHPLSLAAPSYGVASRSSSEPTADEPLGERCTSVGNEAEASDSRGGTESAALVRGVGKGEDGVEASRWRATMPLMLLANQWI